MMEKLSGDSKQKILLIVLVIASLFLLAGIFFWVVTAEPLSDFSTENQKLHPELLEAAEDLNDVLPQRLDFSTMFDSVRAEPNQLNYFYSVSNPGPADLGTAAMDSLKFAAEARIPCTLFRPLYMQGVKVTFTYFSSVDGSPILHFSRLQDECH